MKIFKNIVKNKKVILVGPAPNILGKKYGEFIDSHDIIIRTNGGYPISDNLIEDYGRKTDILFINNKFIKKFYEINIDFYKKSNILLICHKCEISKELKLPNIKYELWGKVDIALYNTINLCGFVILKKLLQSNVTKINITGMDFYKNKNNVYIPNYIPDNSFSLQGNFYIHNTIEQTKIIKQLIKQHNMGFYE